jgi:subtilisin family serine protease
MRTRRRSELVLLLVLGAIGVAAWLSIRGSQNETAPPEQQPVSWRGLVGASRPAVNLGNRMIVVLKTPSVAQRLEKVQFATESAERRWTAEDFAAQQQVLTQLARHGLNTRPDYSYARVLDGFSAVLDPRAVVLLEHNAEVAGVYPVRVAYPATIDEQPAAAGTTPAAPGVSLPGFDGAGITIALLDTGVDLEQPYLGGRVEQGIDIVGGTGSAAAQSNPQNKRQLELHGTELAGVLVGSGGPDGLHGVAPGATVLPIRVAGWQPTSGGRQAVYARSDQIIAGLERAVDPNGDGDTHDAVQIALLGVAEPFASFSDSPEAQAVAGAQALDTLVIAPAGNDGAAGPLYGSIAGPGGSSAALTVGATDPREQVAAARVVIRQGLTVTANAPLPLLGATAPSHALELQLAIPGSAGALRGNAALVPAGSNPNATVAAAVAAGARAVLIYGRALPPASLTDDGVPVLDLSAATAQAALAALRKRYILGVAIGTATTEPNASVGRVAPFSSRGLTFSGGIAPQLTAPGVGIETSNPGTEADGEPAFTQVTGTSVSAAAAAGAAALLAQARPGLSAADLASLLAGSSRPSGGPVDPGAAAVGEVTASATGLSFGPWNGPRWHQTSSVVVHNVSSRRLALTISVSSRLVSVEPASLDLASGAQATLRITAAARTSPAISIVTGSVAVRPRGGQALRLPWVIVFRPYTGPLVGPVRIEPQSFTPSDSKPAILQVVAGRITGSAVFEVQPVARLDVLLYSASGSYLGLLVRARDLLPGTYSFGLTGRGPGGGTLTPGAYQIRINAWRVQGGPVSRAQFAFRIE